MKLLDRRINFEKGADRIQQDYQHVRCDEDGNLYAVDNVPADTAAPADTASAAIDPAQPKPPQSEPAAESQPAGDQPAIGQPAVDQPEETTLALEAAAEASTSCILPTLHAVAEEPATPTPTEPSTAYTAPPSQAQPKPFQTLVKRSPVNPFIATLAKNIQLTQAFSNTCNFAPQNAQGAVPHSSRSVAMSGQATQPRHVAVSGSSRSVAMSGQATQPRHVAVPRSSRSVR
jgi:hypothetical protein